MSAEAPSLTPSSASVTVTEGDIAVLACIASGDPAPVLSWYHIGTLLVGETGENLTLEGVGREEEGVYECVASNQVGDNRATITLVVQSEHLLLVFFSSYFLCTVIAVHSRFILLLIISSLCLLI